MDVSFSPAAKTVRSTTDADFLFLLLLLVLLLSMLKTIPAGKKVSQPRIVDVLLFMGVAVDDKVFEEFRNVDCPPVRAHARVVNAPAIRQTSKYTKIFNF